MLLHASGDINRLIWNNGKMISQENWINWKRNMLQCHFVHHISNSHQGLNSSLCSMKPRPNCRSHKHRLYQYQRTLCLTYKNQCHIPLVEITQMKYAEMHRAIDTKALHDGHERWFKRLNLQRHANGTMGNTLMLTFWEASSQVTSYNVSNIFFLLFTILK
jgi:hypothetical protein